MDCIIHGVAKSWTQLSNIHFLFVFAIMIHLWVNLSSSQCVFGVLLYLQLSSTQHRFLTHSRRLLSSWSYWWSWSFQSFSLGYSSNKYRSYIPIQFSSVAQSWLTSVIWWTAALQASLFIINSWSLLKLVSIESVMPSNHLILCHPLLLPSSIFPSIRIFLNGSVFCIR